MTIYCPCSNSDGTWLSINGGEYTQYPCGVDITLTQSTETAYLFSYNYKASFASGGCAMIQNRLAYITINQYGVPGYTDIFASPEATSLSISEMLTRVGDLPLSAYLSVAPTINAVQTAPVRDCNMSLICQTLYANGQKVDNFWFLINGLQMYSFQKPLWTLEVTAP